MASPDYYLAIARGQVPGITVQNIYGYQAAVDGTTIPLWENATVYTYPSSAATMTLYSSSASDTAVSILINGLDSSYNPISETKVLTNGTTGVTTTNSYIRINSISVTGSNNPVGTIYLSNAGKTTTYAQIAIGSGRSQMSIYTVPNGYTFYLTRVNGYVSPNNNANFYCNYSVYTRNITTGIETILQQAPFVNTYQTVRVAPRPYAAKTDIQWRAQMSSGTSIVSIGVEGILIQGS
jgi:hypothetical protein